MIKILVIEDEDGLRRSIVDTFRPLGYEVLEAATAPEGMAIFKKEAPNIIFLDIKLGECNGLDLLKDIKTASKKNIVIVVSSKDDKKTKEKAFALGVNDYIVKPFYRETIRATLSRNIDKLKLHTPATKPRILIADDEEDVSVSLKRKIDRDIEADVVITFDGDQAYDLLKRNHFDLAIMDINLPGMDGLQVIEKIKANKKNIPLFYVVTGYQGTDSVTKAKQLEVKFYITKPFSPEDILDKLKDGLMAINKYIPK